MTEMTIDSSARTAEANALVRKYMNWSFVGGIVPVPLVDVAAVSGVQLKMLYELSKLYGIPFKAHIAKPLIGSLLGSVGSSAAAGGVLALGIKSVPIVGTMLGLLTMPALSLAATYAVGRVFIAHFESGGTLLDFDPDKMRAHFRAEFEAARKAS
jgi:uncharacterized protein (DUF697 family)